MSAPSWQGLGSFSVPKDLRCAGHITGHSKHTDFKHTLHNDDTYWAWESHYHASVFIHLCIYSFAHFLVDSLTSIPSFTVIKYMWHKFTIFTIFRCTHIVVQPLLCIHLQDLFVFPNETLYLLNSNFPPTPAVQALATTILLSVSMMWLL